MKSLQHTYFAQGVCFGCGPANEKGLHLESRPDGEGVVAEWTPALHHQAFEGVLNGGIIATLLDCHMSWSGMWHLKEKRGLERPPLCVTAEYTVKLHRPTPASGVITLRAHAVETNGDRVVTEGTLEAGGKVCASSRGVFVAVPPDHPAHKHY
jgi:acyl-coenzyme A thioesterase PaaI-like protein